MIYLDKMEIINIIHLLVFCSKQSPFQCVVGINKIYHKFNIFNQIFNVKFCLFIATSVHLFVRTH